MSGTLGHSQVLLDRGGDRQSVVHLLISWCAKGGPGCWLQLVCCAKLWSGVQVFQGVKSQGSGFMPKDVQQGHGNSVQGNATSLSGFRVQVWGQAPEGSVVCRVLAMNQVGHVPELIYKMPKLLEWKVLIYWES